MRGEPKDNTIYMFDIDGVVCTQRADGQYDKAHPYMDRIAKINELYEKHQIHFYTARGTVTGIDWREATENQFNKWGLKYDKIIFGKPFCHFYIDDKSQNDKAFFND